MSGHSKWATTKRQKAVTDAKRGAIFTKLSNLITIAVREKGNDPATNFTLRMTMDKARAANMPKDNIERAIKRGTGELAGAAIEELIYEGLGPAKSQFIIKCLTDNKNRAVANVRHIFTKSGGAFGSAVMWNFDKLSVIRISNDELAGCDANLRINANAVPKIRNEYANSAVGEEFELELIDAGAQDIIKEAEGMTIYAKPEDLQKVKKFLEEKKIKTESAEIEYIAKDSQEISGADKEKIEKFIEELEENEDVADYYTSVNI